MCEHITCAAETRRPPSLVRVLCTLHPCAQHSYTHCSTQRNHHLHHQLHRIHLTSPRENPRAYRLSTWRPPHSRPSPSSSTASEDRTLPSPPRRMHPLHPSSTHSMNAPHGYKTRPTSSPQTRAVQCATMLRPSHHFFPRHPTLFFPSV